MVGGLLEHPQLGRDATEVPEHVHLPRPRTGAPGDGQAPGGVGGGGLELARTPVGQSEPVEGDGLTFRPAGLLTVAHGLGVVLDGLWIAVPVPVEVAKAQGRRDPRVRVALGDRGRPSDAGGVLPGGGGDPQPEVAAEGVGELEGQRTHTYIAEVTANVPNGTKTTRDDEPWLYTTLHAPEVADALGIPATQLRSKTKGALLRSALDGSQVRTIFEGLTSDDYEWRGAMVGFLSWGGKTNST